MNDSKGHRSLWKVPHGWSRPGNWRQNKGASIVSVNLPHREGQFTTTTASGSVDAWKDELPSMLLCISRWLSACTWCISYPQEPQQSSPPAPLFTQFKTALKIIIYFAEYFTDLIQTRSTAWAENNSQILGFHPRLLFSLQPVALAFQISFYSEMIVCVYFFFGKY